MPGSGPPPSESCIHPVRNLLFSKITKMELVHFRKFVEGILWFALTARQISSAQTYVLLYIDEPFEIAQAPEDRYRIPTSLNFTGDL